MLNKPSVGERQKMTELFDELDNFEFTNNKKNRIFRAEEEGFLPK